MEKSKLHHSIYIKIKTITLALVFKLFSWFNSEPKNILKLLFFNFSLYLILIKRLIFFYNVILIFYYFYIFLYFLNLKFNFKRYSNNTVLNRRKKILNMSIKNINTYHKFSYISQRQEISNLLIEEFVEGLINVYYDKEINNISLSTHKWILEKVLDDFRIAQLFEYDKAPNEKIKKIRTEIFPLITWSELLKFDSSIMERIYKPKVQYEVMLTKKEPL